MPEKPDLAFDFDADALERKYAEERSRRLRPEANGQYQPITGELAKMADDPYAGPDFSRQPVVENIDVLIMGGGFGGLLTAGRLRQNGIDNFRIIEKAGDFGGTWYWNRYPGAACDIESYIYLPMLEETGFVPSEKYARASEIFAYCQQLAKHFDLYPAALFQTALTDLRWDDTDKTWRASTDRGDSISARHVVIAGGFLSQPKLPRIPGAESFGGRAFHTSRWDYAYTGGDESGALTGLADKRVGIIGTGATAVQCIPYLAESARHLYVFQRTPSSVDARDNRPTDPAWFTALSPGWHRRRMENFNNIVSGMPQDEDLVSDGWTEILGNIGFLGPEEGTAPDPKSAQLVEFAKMEKSRRRIDAIVEDRATAEALKPWYNYLCKRPCFNDRYLQAFNQANVTLVDTRGRGVERITPRGVVVGGVETELDCLIFATGFEYLTEYAGQVGFDVTGRDGITLSEKWSDGTRTFHGMMTREFPNLYVLGFAQNGIPANYTHLADERAGHLAYVLRRCFDQNIATIEPTQEAEDGWVEEIVAGRGARRQFLDACTPSYYNQEGSETPATALNDTYGPGSTAFFEVLARWREENRLDGLDIEYISQAGEPARNDGRGR
jgi:cation diffusion facilitator CzcD-associated flavoprotein CzcO